MTHGELTPGMWEWFPTGRKSSLSSHLGEVIIAYNGENVTPVKQTSESQSGSIDSKQKQYENCPVVDMSGRGQGHSEGMMVLDGVTRPSQSIFGLLEVHTDGTVAIAEQTHRRGICVFDLSLTFEGEVEDEPKVWEHPTSREVFTEKKDAVELALSRFFRTVDEVKPRLIPGLMRSFFRPFQKHSTGYTIKVNPLICMALVKFQPRTDVDGQPVNVITHVYDTVERESHIGQAMRQNLVSFSDRDNPDFDTDWFKLERSVGRTSIYFPRQTALSIVGPSAGGKSHLANEIVEQFKAARNPVDRDKVVVPILIICSERPGADADAVWGLLFEYNVFWIKQLSIPLIHSILKRSVAQHGIEKEYLMIIESATSLITGASGATATGGFPQQAREEIDTLNALAVNSADNVRIISIFNTPMLGVENWVAGIQGASDLTISLNAAREIMSVRCRVRNDIWDGAGYSGTVGTAHIPTITIKPATEE